MKITREEIIAAILAEKVFNPHEIAEIAEKVQDIEVMECTYREIAQFVRNWGYTDEDPIKCPNDWQRVYTNNVYHMKASIIKYILFDYVQKKEREAHEKSKQTNLKA